MFSKSRFFLFFFALAGLVLSSVVGCGGGGSSAPAAPTITNITAGDTSVTISWEEVSGATQYNIYYSTTTGVDTSSTNKVLNTTSGTPVTGLDSGEEYFFIVTAQNSSGESASDQVSATTTIPASISKIPQNFSAQGGNDQAILTWEAVAGATAYNVYYLQDDDQVTVDTGTPYVGNSVAATASDPETLVVSLPGGNSHTYSFVITSVVDSVESDPSNVASASLSATAAGVPAAPIYVYATAGNGQVKLRWPSVSGADSYNVYYSTTPGVTSSNGTKVTGAVTDSYITGPENDGSGLVNATVYYFVVTAISNTFGESPASPEVFSTPALPYAVEGGSNFSLALSSDGTVWAWGANDNGQLGINDSTGNDMSKTQVVSTSGSGTISDIAAIQAGSAHSLALGYDGLVWAWGLNADGQLGNGNTNTKNLPVQCLDPTNLRTGKLSNIVAIAAGGSHSMALKWDGTVYTWGSNNQGQLGNGDTTLSDQVYPTKVSGLTDVVGIAAGYEFSLALKKDGSVYSWGSNTQGQLGDGNSGPNVKSPTPVQVPLPIVKAIAGGSLFALALTSDGTVKAWGYNGYGQLGDGSTFSRTSPVSVIGLTGITSIAAGSSHSLALDESGGVWAWGRNDSGQVGDKTTSYKADPVRVKDKNTGIYVTGADSIGAGSLHSISVITSNDLHLVYNWGENEDRQLNQGSSTADVSSAVWALLSL